MDLSLWMGDSQERIRYQHLGPIELALSDDESGFQYVRAQPVLVTTTNAVLMRRTCEILFISRKPERFLASWKNYDLHNRSHTTAVESWIEVTVEDGTLFNE